MIFVVIAAFRQTRCDAVNVLKVAISFPINQFHETFLKKLPNIYYDKCIL